MDILFTDKVVQITGAGSGFGRMAALKFRDAGAKLVLSDINEAGLQETMNMLDLNSKRAISMRCDPSKPDDVENMMAKGVDYFGILDIAVNNAGIAHSMSTLENASLEEFDHVMSVNVRGIFLCMQQELKQMNRQSHGVILNVASIAGLIGAPLIGIYTASKHAVVGLTKSTALEYARQNIRINAICPAFCHTPMVQDVIDGGKGDKRERDMANSIPMGRLGTAEEIANGMLWLCSDQNSFTTGQALAFDGGLSTA